MSRRKKNAKETAQPLPELGMSAEERRAATERAAAEQVHTVADTPHEETLIWAEGTAHEAEPRPVAEQEQTGRRAPERPEPPAESAREDDAEEEPAPNALSRAAAVAEERFANLTVENLMHDIFGDAMPGQEKKAEQQPAAPEVSPELQESEPELQEESEPELTAEMPMDSVPTLTRDRDGQMSFVLPDVGKLHSEGEEDDSAHRLFAAFSAPQAEEIPLPSQEETPPLPREETPAPESPQLTALSEEEFQLLLDMDYEDELGHAIGFEKIQKHHELGVNGQEFTRRRRRKATEKREYETQGQDTSLRKYYNSRKREYVVRLVLSLALLLLIFLYERPHLTAVVLRGPFNGTLYPVSYILLGLQLLVLDVALYAKRLLDGFVRLVRFASTDSSLCSVAVLVTVLYHVYLLFIPHTSEPVLYLSPAAGMIALVAASDLLNWYRESATFQVISSRRQKYALISRVSVGGKEQNARERLTDPEENETVLFAHPVGFVRNYFANTDRRVRHNQFLGPSLLFVLSLSVAIGLLLVATGEGLCAVLNGMIVTFLLCMPATSLLITSLPMLLATRLRLKGKGAIIGEGPVYENAERTTVVLPERDFFRPMNHEQFELEESCDITRTMVLTRALLEALQTPLADSVPVDNGNRISPAEVTVTDIAEDGVCARVGAERITVLMGSMAYCQRCGVALQPRAEEEYGALQKRLLLVAVDGRLSALFLANYQLAGDMDMLLRDLAAEHVRVLVRARDPGVNDRLFERLQGEYHPSVRVMKPSLGEVDIRTDRVDATIVALGSCREVVRTFLTARRVRRAARMGMLWQILSVLVGAGITALLAFFGRLLTLPSYLVTVYLFSWCFLHTLTSYLCLREGKQDDWTTRSKL